MAMGMAAVKHYQKNRQHTCPLKGREGCYVTCTSKEKQMDALSQTETQPTCGLAVL